MVADNKEVVRRVFEEIFVRKNEDAIDELFDKNFVDRRADQDLHSRDESAQ